MGKVSRQNSTHRHHHIPKPARIKKILPKTGSYDLTTSINSGDLDEGVLNDKIRLNSAEPIQNSDRTRFETMIVKPDRRPNELARNESTATIEFPRKRTCFGLPLTCLTYFAAIYSIVGFLVCGSN